MGPEGLWRAEGCGPRGTAVCYAKCLYCAGPDDWPISRKGDYFSLHGLPRAGVCRLPAEVDSEWLTRLAATSLPMLEAMSGEQLVDLLLLFVKQVGDTVSWRLYALVRCGNKSCCAQRVSRCHVWAAIVNQGTRRHSLCLVFKRQLMGFSGIRLPPVGPSSDRVAATTERSLPVPPLPSPPPGLPPDQHVADRLPVGAAGGAARHGPAALLRLPHVQPGQGWVGRLKGGRAPVIVGRQSLRWSLAAALA